MGMGMDMDEIIDTLTNECEDDENPKINSLSENLVRRLVTGGRGIFKRSMHNRSLKDASWEVLGVIGSEKEDTNLLYIVGRCIFKRAIRNQRL